MVAIDRSSHLAALIRLQLAAQPNPEQKGALSSSVVSKLAKPETHSLETSVSLRTAPMDAWVRQRVATLSQDDPQRKRKTFRIFLESVLLQEFGSKFIGDSGFDQLVEQVLQYMESDPALSAAIEQAAQALLAESPS
jgi:hypothetical protein